MRRVRRGEVSLMEVLFERHHRKLFRFCWRMTGSQAASEDLVQEVYLRMLRHRETFSETSSFTAWMYSIARNAHADSWRKYGRETPLDGAGAFEAAGGEPLEDRQEKELLHRALLELPPEKREVLVMSRFQEMSHAEIAAVLGCDEGASRARLHRALQSLKQIYLGSLRGRTS